jgi:general secretion pathway protein B
MSFILDALRKSETERQQQASAEFASVPTGDSTPRAPRWLWALGALLAINLVVLLGLVFRSGDAPPAIASTDEPAATVSRDSVQKAPATSSFAEQVEVARRNRVERRAESASEAPQTAPASRDADLSPPAAVRVDRRPDNETAMLPTVQELIVNGTLDIPDLHLDIHVYSENPAERFVFINMSKQRENSRLSEGPLVEEITPDGVVLEYRGTAFVLRRD